MKPTTHSRAFLYTHLVWATTRRLPLLSMGWFEQLRMRAASAMGTERGTIIAFGGVEDHIHVLVRHRPDASISSLVRQMKSGLSHWLRREGGIPDFKWQEGYAAFSVSPSDLLRLKKYIHRQAEHHASGDIVDSWEPGST